MTELTIAIYTEAISNTPLQILLVGYFVGFIFISLFNSILKTNLWIQPWKYSNVVLSTFLLAYVGISTLLYFQKTVTAVKSLSSQIIFTTAFLVVLLFVLTKVYDRLTYLYLKRKETIRGEVQVTNRSIPDTADIFQLNKGSLRNEIDRKKKELDVILKNYFVKILIVIIASYNVTMVSFLEGLVVALSGSLLLYWQLKEIYTKAKHIENQDSMLVERAR